MLELRSEIARARQHDRLRSIHRAERVRDDDVTRMKTVDEGSGNSREHDRSLGRYPSRDGPASLRGANRAHPYSFDARMRRAKPQSKRL